MQGFSRLPVLESFWGIFRDKFAIMFIPFNDLTYIVHGLFSTHISIFNYRVIIVFGVGEFEQIIADGTPVMLIIFVFACQSLSILDAAAACL